MIPDSAEESDILREFCKKVKVAQPIFSPLLPFIFSSAIPLLIVWTRITTPRSVPLMEIVEEACQTSCCQTGWPVSLSQLHELVCQKKNTSSMKLTELKSHLETLQAQGKL